MTTRAAPVRVGLGSIPPLDNVIAIAAGLDHAVAVKADGTVWAWGRNNQNQLGDGTYLNRFSPVQVGTSIGFGDAISIAAGDNHTLAVKRDGTVWGWGANGGNLGDGGYAQQSAPVRTGLSIGFQGVTMVAAGNNHSLALKCDGTVWAWGSNGMFGQIDLAGKTWTRKGQVSLECGGERVQSPAGTCS